jgi:guanylate kinase
MVKELLASVPCLSLAVSATTRPRRPGESDGVEYWFVSDAEFDADLAAGAFLEYHRFPWGQRSGTLRREVDRILAAGSVPLLELELNGSLAVAAEMSGVVTIFVDAPLPELERRLRARATESAGQIEERIALAAKQRAFAGLFDHVVENDDVGRAGAECVAIVEGELGCG